jgi:hypothetical protein
MNWEWLSSRDNTVSWLRFSPYIIRVSPAQAVVGVKDVIDTINTLKLSGADALWIPAVTLIVTGFVRPAGNLQVIRESDLDITVAAEELNFTVADDGLKFLPLIVTV